MTLPVIAQAPVTLRHIKRGSDPGAITVLGASLVAQPPKTINGLGGYQSGSYDPSLNEEGSATLTLPNIAGSDGVLHLHRFLFFTDAAYHAGDEWIEVVQDGRTLFCGTPIDGEKRRAQITLELWDGLGMLNTQREFAAGFWCHAPRDVFEHYTKGWQAIVADDFAAGADAAKWTKYGSVTDESGTVRLWANPTTGEVATIVARSDYWQSVGLGTQRAWRLEATYQAVIETGFAYVHLSVLDASGTRRLSLQDGLTDVTAIVRPDAGGVDDTQKVALVPPVGAELGGLRRLAIEVRDRWVLFYVDGALVHCVELDVTIDTGNLCVPSLGTGLRSTMVIHDVLLRRCDPYLMRGTDKGDYVLPGIMPAGGLQGAYYDEADLRKFAASGEDPSVNMAFRRRVLAPTRQPYARRQDATVNFALATPPLWQPATPPNGEFFSARWTGAIYLDLQASDITLRLRDVDGRARLWVGKTMYGEQIVDLWASSPGTGTGPSMRSHLGTVTGWYPIRIDYSNATGQAGIILEQSIGGGAYVVVPASSLSPYGIYDAAVRYDSHIEQLKAVALAYGYQFACQSRALESGQFPGQVTPKARIGRDTDKVLTPDEATDIAVKVSAGEVIDCLLGDAAGLADQENDAQLTAEEIHFDQVRPNAVSDRHMMVLSAYESLADITDPILLQTRLANMMTLRLSPWEEVSVRPRGHRELRQAWPPKAVPLPADIAAFQWEPGDGLRIVDEALDVKDQTPRQIIAPSWPFNPDGLGAPSVRFRQRPRSNQDALKALVRSVVLPNRNYQGQLAIIDGSTSDTDGGGLYSRVALPANLADIKAAELIVYYKTDASVWTIRNASDSTDLFTVQTTGHYNVLPHISRYGGAGLGGVSQTFIVSRVAGTGTMNFQLRLVVKV